MAVIAFSVAKYLLSYYLTTLLRSAEVGMREDGKQVTNSSSTTSGVARCYPTATSERGHGWAGYLPLYLNARSEASEHAFASRVIPRQDPITSFFLLRRQLTALRHPNSQ